MKHCRRLAFALGFYFIVCSSAFARPEPAAWQPAPMKRSVTNHWHSVKVTPKPGLPKIHFYDKLNPVWWFGNIDEPAAPAWYRPDSKHRNFLWHLRNPLHNLDHYVIGISDKTFIRYSKDSEGDSKQDGGWDFTLARRKLVVLPFLSYRLGRFNFYFGWRERGDFGIKLNLSKPPEKNPSPNP